ncbi:MAG: cytochrome b/b6 domain-containing protein [Flavobacteriia bacterium]|nr:cytochrome b/b6 domain-containing protein [Flavobacteriia bacterium]OIP48281.1 MAG: cytochrome B [Flavobacteriaceae bacterium CG2_30_31_66]PIV97752.1 MAG: cytochrome B [Flavobacteriaceae bacterium CG17_big_fil_post_rev_8_21_14_2_50_31_13]PIX13439.1 MAG: cytochrome B [Flavobacteriaceae bacterium CG_4_8_14_3_um_filter_31_8]PIY14493.1 MAG: cytochrome B [Flavobacteriaceae bacterium CG_4_10_14_3_um_filter_31_253]PIZ10179.1 MAG: cytochrome B [Flavobacteriaceae bacterium CG_4_10_14_0_8_um_filter_3
MKPTYSKIYRILHWSIAISFTLTLITIFLRLTWMNKNNMAEIMENYLSKNDVILTQDQLIVLAKQIRQPMWDWHIYLGYVLTGLFVVRFSLPFFGEMKIQNPLDKNITFKEKIQKWIYIVFYVCVVISLITGLIIKFGPKEFKKSMESIHELSIYYLVTFIVLHIGGVLYAEFTNDKGIISRIVSGYKNKV